MGENDHDTHLRPLADGHTFSKFKKLLRDGAQRTVDKLWELCGRVLDEFTEPECRTYFKHCGYRYS